MSTASKPRLTAGRLLYLLYHQPIGWLDRCRQAGGLRQLWITWRGRLAMERSARTLPPIAPPPNGAPEVCFLTGERFWYQTAFCFWSLCHHAATPLRATFYDDGSSNARIRMEAARLFPGCRFVGLEEIETMLNRELPWERFPYLRARRLVYPNLRKLTDIHAAPGAWRLVLDSDMLFFRRPDLLLEWLHSPGHPLHMTDVQDSYGYSRGLMESLTGKPLATRLNVGLCGLDAREVDWDRIEAWCRQLENTEGTSYYLEQALVAMWLAGKPTLTAPCEDYVTLPEAPEISDCQAVMHHYVADSKRGYFRHCWRKVNAS